MTLIYNNDEFAGIIISVYIYNYNIMNIDINIVKQLFEVYISRNTKKENLILINKFGVSCNINKDSNFYKKYAYNILETNLLTCILDKLKLIQNLKILKNDINEDELSLEEILIKMASHTNDIRYYCNKKIYISYITELECIREKLISDYGNIKQIKKDLIDTIDETIKSTYILDYTIYYTNRK